MKLLLISITTLAIGSMLYLLEDAFPSLTAVCNYLPDGLWAASLTALICFIWKADDKMKLGWCVAGILSMFGFEIAQHFSIVGGTGDIFDCLVYFASSLAIILIDKEL